MRVNLYPSVKQRLKVGLRYLRSLNLDEESGRRRILERMALRLDQRETGGDTSTLDSVQMIDRAKSFEYIPGESFPIQAGVYIS